MTLAWAYGTLTIAHNTQWEQVQLTVALCIAASWANSERKYCSRHSIRFNPLCSHRMLRKFIIFLLFAPHLLAGVVVRIFTNLPHTRFSLKSNIGGCFYVKFKIRAQTCISHFGHLDSNLVLQKIGDNSTEESEEDGEVFGTRHGREKRAMRRSFIVRCCGLKTCQGANLRSRTERYKIQCHAHSISNHNFQHRFWLQWRWAVHTIPRPNLRRAALWGQYLYHLTDLILILIIWIF